MELPNEVSTAVLVSRVAAGLCAPNSGIISVSTDGVRIAESLFHQVFSTWFTEPGEHEYVHHCHNVNGVKVWCTSWKGGELVE